MDTPPVSAQDDEARPEHRTRHGHTLLGGLITIVSAFLLIFMALLAALLAMILASAANGFGDEYPDMLDCRTQACADESMLGMWASLAFIVFVVAALRLAYVSTDRALRLVAIGSFIVAGILLLFLWDLRSDSIAAAADSGYESSLETLTWKSMPCVRG